MDTAARTASSEGLDDNAAFVKSGLDWFSNEAVLIIDNCDCVLNDKKCRKDLFKFIEIMIQKNDKGRIVLTSEEELNLDSIYCKNMNFAVGNLSAEASVELLKTYSVIMMLKK